MNLRQVQSEPLGPSQVKEYQRRGFLHIPSVFSPDETAELADDLDWMISTWSVRDAWTGGWRQELIDASVEKDSKIDTLHDLQLYSGAWARALAKPQLGAAVAQLLDSDAVELHHTTMHVKPPETGMPFPMHQDYPFYPHKDGRYVDVIVHLDDTFHENGELRFIEGSHERGALSHIDVADGTWCTPHLPVDKFRLEDTVAVPAKAGDVVCFSINTIHGSYQNVTNQSRRLVRAGYRDPLNEQIGGGAAGRPGHVVWGRRARKPGQPTLRRD